ncbi:BQ2448_1616 [Microbotryum intermedium]|uniref:BQ2448_1616 protein n=1 Tax=Microbotryum intermedium TaxID=269621 RepID=A0A238F8M4_9BASI|nr:BQ2448_1616 [Microbotryum intermedium]
MSRPMPSSPRTPDLRRSTRARSFLVLVLLTLCLCRTLIASTASASLYGSLVSNLTLPYERDVFVQLAAPRKVSEPPFVKYRGPRGLIMSRLILQHQPALRSPITRNASFSFTDLVPGDYVLSVHSRLARFQLNPFSILLWPKLYAVSVLPTHDVDVRLYLIPQGPTQTKPFPQPLLIPSLHLTSYTDEPEPFSFLHIIKSNPSLLMGLFALVCLAGLPKLLTFLDPETAAEVNKSQAEMHAKLAGFASLGTGADLTTSLSKRLVGKRGGEEARVVEEDEGDRRISASTTSTNLLSTGPTPTGGKGKGGKKRK